jgi:hypothetical protein
VLGSTLEAPALRGPTGQDYCPEKLGLKSKLIGSALSGSISEANNSRREWRRRNSPGPTGLSRSPKDLGALLKEVGYAVFAGLEDDFHAAFNA